MPATSVGVVLMPPTTPLPNWPTSFTPQANNVPSLRNAKLWLRPAAIATTSVRKPMPRGPFTCTGVLTDELLKPRPSWPKPSSPQETTVPSLLSAKL